MRGCWNWRLIAVIFFYFCLCVVCGSIGDSDVDSERTSADLQISDLKQLTIVPDSNVAATLLENTGHSIISSTSTKQKRCNRDRVGATLTSRQNLPLDINLIPRRHEVSQIAKNLCVQCISLNKCKTANECRACSLLCKDVVLLKDQAKDTNDPAVECSNPTTAQGDVGSVVENAASSRGGVDSEQKPTAPDGPVVGSRARFGEEETCGGHHLATVSTGNVKEMILQMVGIQDTEDILSVSVRATTRSGAIPVAKGPEGPEALLTIFKDELTSAIEAENAANGMQEPPTIHELFFKVLEMVQNSKPEVNHVGAIHAEESLSQAQEKDEELAEHQLTEEREGSLASQMITGQQSSELENDKVGPSHAAVLSAAKMQEDNGELDVDPLTMEEEESFPAKGQEYSRLKSDRVGSEHTANASVPLKQKTGEELHEHSLARVHETLQNSRSKIGRVDPMDRIKSPLRHMQEEAEELHEEHEKALAPQVKNSRLEAERLSSAHAEKSSPRQMQEEDGDMLPRFPLAEQPEGFVVPQLANPAIIEGPPPPGMLLGATQKENQTSEIVDEIQNGSPNNLHVEAVDSTEEDLPRYNLADHEGSLVLQVSNISTIGLSSPTGNRLDDSFIPDMEAEASEQKPATQKVQPTESMTGSEAKGTNDLTITGDEGGLAEDTKSLAKQAFSPAEKDDVSGNTESFTKQNMEGATSDRKPFNTMKSATIPEKAIKAVVKDKHALVADTKTKSSTIDKLDKDAPSDIILGTSMVESNIQESVPGAIVGAVSGNKVHDLNVQDMVAEVPETKPFSTNQIVSLPKNTGKAANLEGSTLEAVRTSAPTGIPLESTLELKSKNSRTGCEIEEVSPLGAMIDPEDDSILPSMDDNTLKGTPHGTNRTEAIAAAVEPEVSQKTSLAAIEENPALGAILSAENMPDEEDDASRMKSLGNFEGIATPEAKIDESTVHLKSSLAETMNGGVHGNDSNELIEHFEDASEMQSKESLSTSALNTPAAKILENEFVDSNMHSKHFKIGQTNPSETMEGAALESDTVSNKEASATKEASLGTTAEVNTTTAFANVIEAKHLEKAADESKKFGVIRNNLSPFHHGISDSAVKDLKAEAPVIASQTEPLEKESLSTFEEISREKTEPKSMVEAAFGNKASHLFVSGIENDASQPLGQTAGPLSPDRLLGDGTGGLGDTHVENKNLEKKFDEFSRAGSSTETLVGAPPDNRSEVPTVSRIETAVPEGKPHEPIPVTLVGATVENKFEDSNVAEQEAISLDPKSVSAVEGSPLLDAEGVDRNPGIPSLSETLVGTALENEGSGISQFVAGLSKVATPVLQDSTIARTEPETLAKESDSSSAKHVMAAEFEGRNDMLAESSETKVMNVVVPDEFLGWSKPSDIPTTINIVIPPKPVRQESAIVEKEDLREAEPQDEPEGRDEFAEFEPMEAGEQTDNREAEPDGDFETENQVKESDDEKDDDANANNLNEEFDANPEIEFQLRESDDEAPEEEEQVADDDAPNNIDGDENEEEAPEVRYANADENNNNKRGETLKPNEEIDDDADQKINTTIKKPDSFSRLKKLIQNLQSPQERMSSMMKKGKDRSNVEAEAPALTDEDDSTFPKKLTKTESKIGKMLEKFRDRMHKNKVEEGRRAPSSPTHEVFVNQKNPDNSNTFKEEDSDSEIDRRLSKTAEKQRNQDLGRDSLLEERIDPEVLEQSQDFAPRTTDTQDVNQDVVHTALKSSDIKFPLRNSVPLGNGRISSDSQLKAPEVRIYAVPPRPTQSQSDIQRVFKDPQDLPGIDTLGVPGDSNLRLKETHAQLQQRLNVGNDSPFSFTPGEDLTLQEPDRELALSGVNQGDLSPTTISTIFGEHFPSTPSLSEIISSAKDKFRKTFEENTRTFGTKDQGSLTGKTLDRNSRPIVGSANQGDSFHSTLKTNPRFQEAPGFDRLLGDSTSTIGVSRSNIQSPLTGSADSVNGENSSPDKFPTFQRGPGIGKVLGDSAKVQNSELGSIDGASVRRTIQETGQSTGHVIQDTSNILRDTIRNSKQGIGNIFEGVNDLASRSNGQHILNKNVESPNTATLGNNLQTGIGIPRYNLNRFGQVNLGTSDQEGVSGVELTSPVTVPPSNRIGKLNLGKLPATLQPFNRIEEAHLRQPPTEGSSGYTGVTLPITVNPLNRIGSLGNFKPITVSEIDVKDPINVENLQRLGRPLSELIVEPSGLDTSDSNDEEMKTDQTGIPKRQGVGVVKQNEPVVTEGLPTIGKFDVHTPFSILRNNVNKPTANPISNFEAAKNALLKLQQLTGRLRKKDGNGKKGTATNEEQPSVTDVVKVLQEISKEVISTAENVSKSKAKEPNVVGSQTLSLENASLPEEMTETQSQSCLSTLSMSRAIVDGSSAFNANQTQVPSGSEEFSIVLENSWENLQPFIPRDSHPFTITKPTFPHQHHIVGMASSTTLKTPLQASGARPLFHKLLDRTSTYYTTPSAAEIDYNIQKAVAPRIDQFSNSKSSSTLPPSSVNDKIKEQHQTFNALTPRPNGRSLPVKSSVTRGNGLIPIPSGFTNDNTNRVGAVQSNNEAAKPISSDVDRELPLSTNSMFTPIPDEVVYPVKPSITATKGLIKLPSSFHPEAMKTNDKTVKSPSIDIGKPAQLTSVSRDLSSSTMSSSSSDRVESMQLVTKNIEGRINDQAQSSSSPVLASRHQNAISVETPRDIYFVGTGMKLPLQMVKKEGGEVHLSVDIDKLCSCKNNSSCTKNQSSEGSELKKDLVGGENSSNLLAVDDTVLGVEKPASDGFAKRNIPTHRSLRDVEDRYAVEWEIEEPEERHSNVHLSTNTRDTGGEHRIEIEIDDPVIIPTNSSSTHTEETKNNIKIANRFSASTDDLKLEDIKLTVGSPQSKEKVMVILENDSGKNLDAERNAINKIRGKVSSDQPSELAVGSSEMPKNEKNDTPTISKARDLPTKSLSHYGSDDTKNTDQSSEKYLNEKKDQNFQYSNPFRRFNYPEVSSENPMDNIESVTSSTEKSTYLSNLLKKLRSRLPTQEPKTVNTNLRSPLVPNMFSHIMRTQELELPQEPKPIKLSDRFKDLSLDRYSNLALRNRFFPTLGRQKEPSAKLEKIVDDEKKASSIEDENKEKQGTGIMKNLLSWFKNLNKGQKR